jgi:hypothetical protein
MAISSSVSAAVPIHHTMAPDSQSLGPNTLVLYSNTPQPQLQPQNCHRNPATAPTTSYSASPCSCSSTLREAR